MGIKEAKLLLMKTSKDVPGLHGKVASGGVVNAEAFVRNASLGGGYISLTCHSKSFELQPGEAKSQEYIFNGIESGILKYYESSRITNETSAIRLLFISYPAALS
eukprot:GHVQ01013415.1.p1 GENE.GHVQ01013415.1~~GHVQ01013415.1.p1  ORF type:complete len:105 (+),score=8.71 GHVQ01013415.1:88-402(+)